jgi:hypothetical protein
MGVAVMARSYSSAAAVSTLYSVFGDISRILAGIKSVRYDRL